MQTLKLESSQVSVFSKACIVLEYQNSIYFLKQMARCSYGNLSSSSLNMKMLNRWSAKLPSLLWLSLTLFYFSSNNKLTCALWDKGHANAFIFIGEKPGKTVVSLRIIRHSQNHQKAWKTRMLAQCERVFWCVIWQVSKILCLLEHTFILWSFLMAMSNYLSVIFGYGQIM